MYLPDGSASLAPTRDGQQIKDMLASLCEKRGFPLKDVAIYLNGKIKVTELKLKFPQSSSPTVFVRPDDLKMTLTSSCLRLDLHLSCSPCCWTRTAPCSEISRSLSSSG